MPEGDSKKRSRSPSSDPGESDKHQHKRVHTGADDAAATDGAQPGAAPTDVNTTAPSDAQLAAPASPKSADDSTSTTKAGDTTASASASSSAAATTPSAMIHLRCLIVTQDASIIIGKGGAHVNEIRERSGARVVVSESIPGNPERILNVSGPLDAVSKAFGLIVRRINDEPFDVPSVPGSRAVTIKFMIPNSRMGSVIGKQGMKIKEIQEASGARLNASEGMLPGSTERVLSVAGVADAIHIATYYIGNILLEAQSYGGSTHTAQNHASYRPAPAYAPQPHQAPVQQMPPPHAAQGHRGPPAPAPPMPMPMPGQYGMPHPYAYPTAYPPPPQFIPGPGPGPQQLQTQQIFIPNDLVGCIIGKGGAKINEIRNLSSSQIKIMEPGAVPPGTAPGSAEGERLVVITGPPANIQIAVGLLYTRLEQEKQKQMMGGRRGSSLTFD